jgi:hypothetical protein
MFTKDDERKYHKVVARSWTDKGYRDRLLADPRGVFKEEGIEFPEHVDVSVKHGATKGKIEVAIPSRPEGMSDDDIKSGKGYDPQVCFC